MILELQMKYIDTVQRTLDSNTSWINKVVFLQTLTSFMLFAVVFKLINIGRDSKIFDISFNISQEGLLLGGIFIISVGYIYQLLLYKYGHYLATTLINLYNEAGFNDGSFSDPDNIYPFCKPSVINLSMYIIDVFINKKFKNESKNNRLREIYFLILYSIFFLFIFLLPVVAMFTAFIQLLKIFSYALWIWVIGGIIAYIIVGWLILGVFKYIRLPGTS